MSGENQPVASTSFHNLGTAAENLQIGSSYQHWTLASFLARARWDYQGKYYANIACVQMVHPGWQQGTNGPFSHREVLPGVSRKKSSSEKENGLIL